MTTRLDVPNILAMMPVNKFKEAMTVGTICDPANIRIDTEGKSVEDVTVEFLRV